MNYETAYESDAFEAPMFGETAEESNWGFETPGAMTHPEFGMVTPITGEYGDFEQYEAGETYEAPARYAGMVPHPVFGMVKPIRGRAGASEVYEREEEVQFEALNEEILGGDERFQVTDTTLNPWRWICFLELRFPGFEATGSGLLISPRHVLTCGHNLIDRSSKSTVQAINVTPGCNGASNRPFGSHAAASWRTSDQWRSSFNRRFDFGLITLRQPIGNQRQRALANKPLDYWSKPSTRTLILPIPPASPALRGVPVTLSGYPADKPHGEQWAAKGAVVSVTPNPGPELIYYSSDSCAGHSGSPIWRRRGDKICLIAIHTGGCIFPRADCRAVGPSKCSNTPTRRETTSNRAVLITPALWARVRSWMGP